MAILLQLPSGQTVSLESNTVTIGSDPGCDLALPEDGLVRPRHAKIRMVANRWMVESEGDWPIRVGNGVPGRKCWLKPGDEIHLTESGAKIIFNLTQRAGHVTNAADMALGEEEGDFPMEMPAEQVADQESTANSPVTSVRAAAAATQPVEMPSPSSSSSRVSEEKRELLPTPAPVLGSGSAGKTVGVPSPRKPPPPIPETLVEATLMSPAPKRPPPVPPDEASQRSASTPVRPAAGPPPVPNPEPPLPQTSSPPQPSRLTTAVEQLKEKARKASVELPKVAEAAKTWAGQQAGAIKEKVAALKAEKVVEQGWYYAHDGERQGPVSFTQLKELVASGQLRPSDLLWRHGMATGIQASTVEELFSSPGRSGPPPVPSSEVDPVTNLTAISGVSSPEPSPLVSAYEHREVVEGIVADLVNRGVSRKAAAPLLWRMAWKIGLHVPPPHLMPSIQLALFAGFAVAVVVGLVDLLLGSLQNAVQNALVIGVLAGIGSSIYYRHSARKIGLPNWDNYPKPSPVDGPALWNPIAAGLLSFVFSWAFGGFILARNWRSLGELSRAFRCMIWFYSWFGWLLLGIITPDTTVIMRFFQVSWYVIGGLFFFVEVVPQHKAIRQRFRDAYPLRRWSMPIGIGVGCFVLLVLAATLFQSGSTANSGNGRQRSQVQTTTGSSQAESSEPQSPRSGRGTGGRSHSSVTTLSVPSGARELVAQIGSPDGDWILAKHNGTFTSLKCYATNDDLIIDFDVDTSTWVPVNKTYPLLVRLFDRNGKYLTHFTTVEGFTAVSEVREIHDGIYRRFMSGGATDEAAKYKCVLLKPKGNRLVYGVNVRDLRDASMAEVALMER